MLGSPSRGRSHAERVAEAVNSKVCAATSGIAASWRRSMVYHGLDPASRRSAHRVEEASLRQARERSEALIRVALPTLERLYTTLGTTGCSVVLTDADGLILEGRRAAGDARDFDSWGLTAGAVWSEAMEGTNGIGTCAAERRPVVIHQDQHFRADNTSMSCMGAPIFDPHGQMAGVLDLSSCRRDLELPFAQMLGLIVAEGARAVESDLFRAAYAGCRIVVADGHGAAGVSLLALDADDIIVGATRHARRALDLTDAVLSSAPAAAPYLGEREGEGRGSDRAALRRALARARGNVSAAARDLGISRATMYRKMAALGVEG
ncbi:GAF domain-containing protein [Microvirga tunisiensis]|uniref:GAF domain-containing protein n=2 Tax=Pannonibacter tanglangensis TaxID=2750084 RepID=A0A7X5J974_9HYPH|nr:MULTISPECIES: GAF domain-containing protein [unclassified Pannonibacter]NBN64713.1 GAF domain-containing protein [Pannonibacter sp. XCT-34]NBN79247.1 GAF domain-containing protein [Pannonibacter sp. XCT-53]